MVKPEDTPAGVNLPTGGFLLNVNLVFVGTVGGAGFAFLAAVLMARSLGDDGLGVTALYRSAVTLGVSFFSLGIGIAAVYFVARSDFSPRQAMEAGLLVTLIATAFTALGVLIAWLVWDEDLAAKDVPYWFVLIAVPAVTQFHLLEGVLRAQGRFGTMNLLALFLPLTILGALGLVEAIEGLTVESTVIAWTLAILPAVVLGYVMLGADNWPRRLAGAQDFWRAVRFGAQAQLSNLIQLLNLRLDSYLVLVFVNAAGVGIYAVGVALSEGMWFIANSVGIVLLTNLTASDDESAARMTPVICRNTLLVTGVAAIGAAAVSPLLLPLIFGSEYHDSVLPFVWLLPGTVAAAGTKILAAYVFSRGRPLINAQVGVVTLVATVAGDVILIPPFGVPGAAAASSIAYGVSLALTALAYRRLSGGPIGAVLLPRISDAALYVDGVRSLARRLPPGGPA